jgi:hypothetical protein
MRHRSPKGRDEGRAALHCSALLAARLAVPPPLPATRWALAPPFHPHRGPLCGPRFAVRALSPANCHFGPWRPQAVCFLWRYLSPREAANRPPRRPGNYPALRSREPGLSSMERPRAFHDGGAARPNLHFRILHRRILFSVVGILIVPFLLAFLGIIFEVGERTGFDICE